MLKFVIFGAVGHLDFTVLLKITNTSETSRCRVILSSIFTYRICQEFSYSLSQTFWGERFTILQYVFNSQILVCLKQ